MSAVCKDVEMLLTSYVLIAEKSKHFVFRSVLNIYPCAKAYIASLCMYLCTIFDNNDIDAFTSPTGFLYRLVQKAVPQVYFSDNFRKCTLILTIFSLLEKEICDA